MKINDTVICKNNDYTNIKLTINKEYKIIFIDNNRIKILDDDLYLVWVPLRNFYTKEEIRKLKLNSL
ncbi:hypothetical protein M0Q50_07385 [bacterium]|jgi:hypothetical protein|nr:hypothetical protein [bacterium]